MQILCIYAFVFGHHEKRGVSSILSKEPTHLHLSHLEDHAPNPLYKEMLLAWMSLGKTLK